MSETPLIELKNITKRYGVGAAAFDALKGVSFAVHQGEFLAVMGPSGSGKSTTMNIIGALDSPTSGEYLFEGVHVETLTKDERALLRRRCMGFVFQGFNLLARTTALENVASSSVWPLPAQSSRTRSFYLPTNPRGALTAAEASKSWSFSRISTKAKTSPCFW